jgi:hypothetical protein
MRFFVKSYIRMTSANAKKVSVTEVEKAGKDALKGVERMNGKINGAAVNGNGHVNGYANGYANGHANGKATNGKA